MKTEIRKKEKTQVQWKLGVTHSTRERQRERKKKHRETLFQNSNSMYMCVCSMHTFIQVLTRTDRSTIVLQCSLRAPTLTPKYIPSGISLLASSRFSAQNRRIRSVPTNSVLGLSDRSQPIRLMLSLYLNIIIPFQFFNHTLSLSLIYARLSLTHYFYSSSSYP